MACCISTPSIAECAPAASMVYGEGLPGGFYVPSTGQFCDYVSGAPRRGRPRAHARRDELLVAPGIRQRVRGAQRVLLGHDGHQRRILLPASRNGPAESRLPHRGRRRPGRAVGLARWIPVDGQPRALRPARSLQQARGAAARRGQRQRRRPHQLRHSEPRVLPRHRGGHEPHVRHSRAGCRRLESRADREGVLPRLHAADACQRRRSRWREPSRCARRRISTGSTARRTTPSATPGPPWG